MTEKSAVADPIVSQLLGYRELIDIAVRLHGFNTETSSEIDLGTFELTPKLIVDLERFGFTWEDKQDFLRSRTLAGRRADFSKWEMTWSRDEPATVVPYAFLRTNAGSREVEAIPDIRPGKHPHGVGVSDIHGASLFFMALEKQRPESELHCLLKRLAGSHAVRIALFDELGYGKLKTVSELFDVFSARRPKRLELAESDISPFRPKDVWGYYAPEALWPTLLDGWAAQLKEFKQVL